MTFEASPTGLVCSAASATIVTAIALAVLAPGEDAYAESQRRAAYEDAHWFAFEALPRWARTTNPPHCPPSVAALIPYTNLRWNADPWNRPWAMRCSDVARGAIRASFWSGGPDRQFGGDDDIVVVTRWAP